MAATRSPVPTALATLALLGAVEAAAQPGSPPESQPLWELGIGATALHLPDYRGSDASRGYLLPLPWIVYRGRVLRADRGGARLMLLDRDRLDFDISLNAGPPAHSDPQGVRAGMPDLPATVEIGPKLRTVLWQEPGGLRLSLDLPLRAAVTLRAQARHVGTVFAPNLDLNLPTGTPWRLGLQAGPVWGSRRLHEHYYGVRADQAVSTPILERPAYAARSGYGGWHTLASVSRRHDGHWVGAFVRNDQLGGAVFDDSPLLRRRSSWSAGVAIAWVLATSDQRVTRSD